MSRPRRFWLRFFVANWYATTLCVLIIGVAVNAIINHQHPQWKAMAGVFGVATFFLWFSWYRWNANLAKAAITVSAKSGSVSLDTDGVRSTFASGATTFVPWSTFSAWKEGQNTFLLTGENAMILPFDEGTRDSIRSMLMSRIS